MGAPVSFILCQIVVRAGWVSLTGILAEIMSTQSHNKRLLHVVRSFSPAAGGTSEGIRQLAESWGAVEVVCLDAPSEPFVQGAEFPRKCVGARRRGHYGHTPRLAAWLKRNLARFDGVVLPWALAISQLWQLSCDSITPAVCGFFPMACWIPISNGPFR